MSAIFDHLIAIAVGVVVLTTLLTLQMRDRAAAMRGTVNEAAQSKAMVALDMLAQDFDNAMSESLARSETGTYRCSLVRSGDDERTMSVELPAYVRPTPGADPEPAHVQYTLIAEGDSVRVGERMRPRYALQRAVDRGMGYGPAQTVARSLTDLDVTFRGRASERRSGAPPLRFTSISVALALALDPIGQVASDQAYTGTQNQVSVGVAVRPPNLTTGV